MRSHENIEKIFMDEIREKKKTGSGSFHKRGKGVKHGISGALRTPYHFMKTKERNKLNGEVKVTYMYETIIPYSEFKMKDLDIQKNMLLKWREIYPNDKIKEEMKLHNKGYFDLVESFNLPKKARGGSVARKSKPKTLAIIEPLEEPQTPKESATEQTTQKLISNGLHLEYNGEYSADQLSKIFTKLQLLTDSEENKFTLSISLTERT